MVPRETPQPEIPLMRPRLSNSETRRCRYSTLFSFVLVRAYIINISRNTSYIDEGIGRKSVFFYCPDEKS